MRLFLFVFATSVLRAAASRSFADEDESKVKTILFEATEFEAKDFVSEASVVYPQNLTFPAPKTYEGIGRDLGEPQHMDPSHSKEIYQRIEDARVYVEQVIRNDEKLSSIQHLCKNMHPSCAFWSVVGECDNNPGYMHMKCAPVCRTCDKLHVETRCPLDPDAVDAFAKPGDVNHLFERIVTEERYQKYEPVALSRPPDGPWLIQFENVLNEEEAQRLIDLGAKQGYERSSDVGEQKEDGTFAKNINSGRTSTNAWCLGSCMEDEIAIGVVRRIEEITSIPETNSENLQLLRYEPDQYYQEHSDYIPYQKDRQCGVRILTFYMYLNDVEEGGGTRFPALNMTVTPKRGRAVLWPSVYDEDPNKKDPRTVHTALKVIKGVKYGANAWIHQRDFKGPNRNACT
ncbi:2-oxyglutarate/Fe(II) oxygenase [Nitzschia inconspicua]|uniref:2-oxyglutarate/Fe(II) oxygenase n=1 Tax=Nitzschia inconspicua TaxID=303405 RepID=A0A9K3LNA1_9STRA|nr:2-oxyglutarate/Fe(II) oxygenase [Nitzschia inconspicua]